MATTQQPEKDAGLTKEAKLHMAKLRATRALTVAITNESWGKAMNGAMRHAVAEYMRRFHLDIGEVDILGGKPYRNGNYYKRRIAELRSQGRVEWSEGEHIGHDERLDLLMDCEDADVAKRAKEENTRRLFERIRLAVPKDATHAYVVRVKLKSDGKAQEGCDWIQPTKMKKVKEWENGRFVGWVEKPADPVGIEEPEKTVVTRAWRRAGLLVAAEIPELRQEEEVMDAEAVIVEEVVQSEAESEAKREEEINGKPKELMASPLNPSDPYGLSGTTADKRTPEPVPVNARPMSDEDVGELQFNED